MTKIDPAKIDSYLKEYPKSKTLKLIIRYIKEVQVADDEQLIFKMGVRTAYHLDAICDPDKANYVRNEIEKKHFLEISKELFKDTIGVKK